MVYLDATLGILGGLFILWCLLLRFGPQNSLRSIYNRYKLWPSMRWTLAVVVGLLMVYLTARVHGDL
jgi:hypothetical protein